DAQPRRGIRRGLELEERGQFGPDELLIEPSKLAKGDSLDVEPVLLSTREGLEDDQVFSAARRQSDTALKDEVRGPVSRALFERPARQKAWASSAAAKIGFTGDVGGRALAGGRARNRRAASHRAGGGRRTQAAHHWPPARPRRTAPEVRAVVARPGRPRRAATAPRRLAGSRDPQQH